MRPSYFNQRSWENGPDLSPAADLCTKQSDALSLKHQQPFCLILTPDQMTPDGTRARTLQHLWLYGTTRNVSSNAVVLQQRRNIHGGFSPTLWRCACNSPPLQSLVVLILSLSPSHCLISALSWGSVARRARRDLEDGRSLWETFVILTLWWMWHEEQSPDKELYLLFSPSIIWLWLADSWFRAHYQSLPFITVQIILAAFPSPTPPPPFPLIWTLFKVLTTQTQ